MDPVELLLLSATFAAGVLGPFLVLFHEMGHAIAAIEAGRRPTVFVGRQPALVRLRFRSFDLHFHPWLIPARSDKRQHRHDGLCLYDPRGQPRPANGCDVGAVER